MVYLIEREVALVVVYYKRHPRVMKLSKGSNQIRKVKVEKRRNCMNPLMTGTLVTPDIFDSDDGRSPSSDIEATTQI